MIWLGLQPHENAYLGVVVLFPNDGSLLRSWPTLTGFAEIMREPLLENLSDRGDKTSTKVL